MLGEGWQTAQHASCQETDLAEPSNQCSIVQNHYGYLSGSEVGLIAWSTFVLSPVKYALKIKTTFFSSGI